MSNYTSSLGFEQINPGDQAGLWGNTTNSNLSLIDQAIAGVTPIDFTGASGSTVVLTDYNGAVDQARSAVLNLTGSASGANTIVVPNLQKTYLVRNGTGQSVTFQTPSPSATYTVLSGNSILIFVDGNNNVYTGIQSPSSGTLTIPGGGTGVTTFGAGGIVKSSGGTANLTASAVNLGSAEVTGTLAVSSGGTGQNNFTSGALLVGNGTGQLASLTGGTTGYVATWNGSTWTSQPAGAGVLIGNNTWTGTNNFSGYTPTVFGYPVLTTNTGVTASQISNYAYLPGSNTFASGTTQNFAGGVTIGSATSNGNGSITSPAYNISQYTSIFGGPTSMVLNVSGSGSNPLLTLTTSTVIVGANYWLISSQDGTANLGAGSNRWNTVYATNGTINTSDANEKQQIANLTAAELAVAKSLKGLIKTFKFNDAVTEKGGNARIHVGVIAQDVQAAFMAQGLDPNNYGVFCSDTWYEVNGESLDEDKNFYTASSLGAVAVTRLGVRYDELFSFIIAGL
jgi:hypothetical protein